MQKETLIQKLENRNQDLQRRLRDVESDRDRLRDIVHRTPGISDLAYRGARSPPPRGGPESVPPPPPLPPGTYATAESGSGERPSRRRRTDPQSEYNNPYAYSSASASASASAIPIPTTLPPPTNYSHPLSRPDTPSSTRTERLPPLRLEQAMGAPPATTFEPHRTGTPTQSFPPYRREHHESGWATNPRRPD